MKFQPIILKEPIVEFMINEILKCVPKEAQVICRMEDIRIASGCGVIDDHTRCVWDDKGHRITFSRNYQTNETTFMRSKIPDPMCYDYTNLN